MACQGRAGVLTAAGLNEYFSGFDNIGHNPPMTLLFLWIIPKFVTSWPLKKRLSVVANSCSGAWLVLPTYMIYVMGGDILDAFALASRTKDE